MANATVTRLGAINGAVSTVDEVRALFLKVFSGEVLTSFEQTTVAKDRVMVRGIQNAKSAQFPCIGNVTASYHVPGAEIVGQVVKHAERTITIDGVLLSDVFIAQIDELMN